MVWIPCSRSGPGIGVRATTPRKAMECARPLGWMALSLRSDVSFREPHNAGAVSWDDDPASGLICRNRIPSTAVVLEIAIKDTSVVGH